MALGSRPGRQRNTGGSGQRDWLKEYEEEQAARIRARQQGAPPDTSRPRQRDYWMPSRYHNQNPGRGQSAVIPAVDWHKPNPKGMPGIAQEPNSPWGVAVHDPLERQFVTGTILRHWPLPGRTAQPQASGGGWGAGYYPRSYGGGGGGGWGGYTPQAPNNWWDPGLFNWRYGVSY
jgi:hypothetical protein